MINILDIVKNIRLLPSRIRQSKLRNIWTLQQSCGCKSNIASVLAQSGVKILAAGGIGNGAVNVLANNGIKTIKGASGLVRNAVELFLQGELVDSGDICHSHDPNHVCQH